jgi:diacylglycerol kinase family enzyme
MARMLRVLHRMNGTYLSDEALTDEAGEELASREDFDGPMDVVPVSDPNIFSEAQRFAQVQAVAQRAPAARWAVPETLPQALDLLRALPRGSRVVALGGDGTVNRWLPALLERGHTLGLVPMGSGNDLARALGVFGRPWVETLECALTSAAVPMDVGLVEVPAGEGSGGVEDPGTGHHPYVDPFRGPFLSSLAVGFDASVGLRALRGPRWLRGQPRYLWATLQELVHLRSWDLRIECDGGAPDGEGERLGSGSPGQGGRGSQLSRPAPS